MSKYPHAAIVDVGEIVDFSTREKVRSVGFDNAIIKCDKCSGWRGIQCPYCSVRLISTQKEDDAKLREKLHKRAEEHKSRLAEIRERRGKKGH